MFNGSVQTCSEEGARPLVDNRYFLVQVTNRNVRGEALTTTVTKVTVLVRKHNCTASLRYEASSDEEGLPRGFVDGTTFQMTSKHSVEVLWQDDNYVEIALHFIHSSIHIRRQGPYLSVSVRAPTIVLETGGDVARELCWSGCRKSSRIPAELAVEMTKKFAECYRRRVHVPKKVAEGMLDLTRKKRFFFQILETTFLSEQKVLRIYGFLKLILEISRGSGLPH